MDSTIRDWLIANFGIGVCGQLRGIFCKVSSSDRSLHIREQRKQISGLRLSLVMRGIALLSSSIDASIVEALHREQSGQFAYSVSPLLCFAQHSKR
jgi:hypothetical protein